MHRMRADYKICGTLVLLALSGTGDGVLFVVLMLLGLAWMANISGREIYLTMRKLTWLLFGFVCMDTLQHFSRRLGSCYRVLFSTGYCRAVFNGVDKNHL